MKITGNNRAAQCGPAPGRLRPLDVAWIFVSLTLVVVLCWEIGERARDIARVTAEREAYRARYAECRAVAGDLGRALGEDDYDTIVALRRQIDEARR